MIANLKAKLDALGRSRPAPPPQIDTAAPASSAPSCLVVRKEYPLDMSEAGASLARGRMLPMEEVSVLCRTELPSGLSVNDILFLDTETTGLAGGTGVVAFLVGLGWYEGDVFVMEQYFMEDYDREEDMLERVCARVRSHRVLASFNGKTFDVPLLESRAIMHRKRLGADGLPHLDLLHACRRLLHRRLERCNFSGIEEALLDFTRVGDVPGSMIPDLYFAYLKNRDMTAMEQVMEHNRMDVVHMPRMLECLCSMLRRPECLEFVEDTLSCGILFERNGDLPRACACYEAIAGCNTEAITRLSMIKKRAGDYDGAMELWRDMVRRRVGGAFAYVEAAKAYEHYYKDPGKALHATEVCMRRLREMGILHGDTMAELEHRRARLLRKTRRIES